MRLCRAARAPLGVGLGPRFGLWPIDLWAKAEPRAKPHYLKFRFEGAAEPRLTSGGEAVTAVLRQLNVGHAAEDDALATGDAAGVYLGVEDGARVGDHGGEIGRFAGC